jgi:hypothetical protein
MMTTRRWCGAGLTGVGLALAILAPACSASVDDQGTPYNGNPADGSATDTSVAMEAATVMPLCTILGGYAVVQSSTLGIITKLEGDCRIGPYFTSLSPAEKQHHADCMQTFLAASAECVDSTGAKIAYLGAKDSMGVACKAIPEAHIGLKLTRDDYTAFQEDVVAALTEAKITPEGRNAIIGILNGQPGVYNAGKRGNAMCYPATCMGCEAVPDAGLDADAATDAPTEGG